MAAVTIGIAGLDESKSRALNALAGHEQGAFISFASIRAVVESHHTKTVGTVAGYKARRPAGDPGSRPPRRADVKSVHGDISALQAGIIDRTENGRIEFPYDAIHVDFVLRAA